MALSKNEVDNIIKGFIDELQQVMPLKEVILFGSYAQGKAKEYSDIDLAIISNWFGKKTKIESMKQLSRMAASYNTRIEAIPFTEEEYDNLDNRTFLAGIVKTGRSYRNLCAGRP
jgi:predicted nucleotidyltransferase